MPDVTLVRASIHDAEIVAGLLAAAGRWLAGKGFANWSPPFPLLQVQEEIEAREVYLGWAEGQPIATVSIGESAVRPYEPGFWGSSVEPGLYMNRLAVDPSHLGSGIGSSCVLQIHQLATSRGYALLRCDVLSQNTQLRAFYERLGYELRGERSHSGWRFACYECNLNVAASAG